MELGAAEWSAVFLSLKVATWATVLSLPLAIWVAYALARKRFWGHSFLNAVVHLPLVLPPVVTGYVLLILFGRTGAVGKSLESVFGIVIAFQWTGAVLAAAIMAFPLMVRAIRLAIEAVDPKLEQAALTLGVRPSLVFATITLPLILPGILAGMVLSFAKAIGGIRGDNYIRVKHPRTDSDNSIGDLFCFTNPWPRTCRHDPRSYISRYCDNRSLVSEGLSRRIGQRIAGQ